MVKLYTSGRPSRHDFKRFCHIEKSINFASHLTGSRPVKNFFNKLTAVFKEMKKDIHPKEYREVVFKRYVKRRDIHHPFYGCVS